MQVERTGTAAVAAGAGVGLSVGAVLAGAENLWLVAAHDLAFDDALDRALFLLGGTALEATVTAGAGGALALLLLAGARRGGGSPPIRSIAIPVGALLVLLRALPWIDGLLLNDLTRRIQLVIDVGLALGAGAGALLLHRRLRGAGSDRRGASRPGSGAVAAVALVAALAFGARILLPGGGEELPAGPAIPGNPLTRALSLPEKTPVILILVDTLRADHLSYAGYERETSPNVDRLAREGVIFERAIGQATRTSPNMASLVTGTAPTTHGLITARSLLDDDLVTWGEILQDQGYATAAILANPNMGHRFHFTQGMGHVEEVFDEDADDASAVFPRGLAWLAGRRKGASFLWLHLIDPHSPYAAPGRGADVYRNDDIHRAGSSDSLPFTQTRLGGVYPAARLEGVRSLADYVARYDAEIRFLDEQLGVFLEGLERLDLSPEPLIVFTSDHGESLGDHDYYFSHGSYTYDATARVPLVFHHSALPGGARVSQMVRTMDILPTVLDLLGVPAPASLEGRSLVPFLAGERLSTEPSVIFAGAVGQVEVAVRDDRYKLVARPVDAGLMDDWTSLKLAAWPNARRTSPLRGKQYRFALYDLVADPDETTDLAGRVPDVQAALVSYLIAHTQHGIQDFRKRQVADSEISDDMQEQLRALGYVE